MSRGYRDEFEEDETVEIEDVCVKAESDKAILVQFDDLDEIWIPKSQLAERSEVKAEGDSGTLVISRWIAEQKGIEDRLS